MSKKDKRPDPKPRNMPHLWQSYLWWNEVMELRKGFLLRIDSAEKGKSNLDAQYDKDMMASLGKHGLDKELAKLNKIMINYGAMVGPVWHWGTSIKGLGAGGLLAQLLAQIDDISNFRTISKLWRFAGWAVYPYWVKDGEVMAPEDGWQCRKPKKGEWALYGRLCAPDAPGAVPADDYDSVRHWVVPMPKPGWELKLIIDRPLADWVLPFNRQLKSVCWQIVDQFIKQQTPIYVDLYYEEKRRLRKLHPERVKVNGRTMFNDGHIDNRARRKIAKVFLQHLWLVWRSYEGLEISKPWVQEHGGHTNIVPPPNFPVEGYPLPLVG